MFATAVSHALDLPVYDTQCGAKVLRVNAATATLFAAPFRSPWIFDVELIARYLRLPVAPGEPARRDRLYELVVPAWHDRPGSKLRWYDFARAVVELGYIWRERVAHRPPDGTTSAVAARAGILAAIDESSRPPTSAVDACMMRDDPPAPRGRPGAGEHTMSNEKQPPTPVSRRTFMGTAATAAGITIVPRHVLGGTGFQAPSDTVNVAVVGYIARHGHVEPAQRGEERQHRRAVRLRRERGRQGGPGEARDAREVPEGGRSTRTTA